MVGRKTQQWRKAIGDAANILRNGQGLDVNTILHLQSLTETLLQHSSLSRTKIAPGTQECDAFLHPQIAALEGADRAAAVIGKSVV